MTPLVVPLDGRSGLPVELIGNKAFGLNRMRALGLPSPPAFVITTAAFGEGPLDEAVWRSVLDHVAGLDRVSVRSGAAVSLPGMMDTVLDVGPDELRDAIVAVRASWWSDRARSYRDHYGIAHDAGTAVIVQAMVFGDRDDRSGTGVAFSRDPVTGEPGLSGEWLPCARGDELVSGRRTPGPISAMDPALAAALAGAVAGLERDLGDVVEVEFTVESGRLHLLQCRAAKPAPPTIATAVDGVELARGLPACPGTAVGLAVGDVDEALARAEAGEAVVLVRPFTSPRDVAAMLESVAVVTERGGASSHAAVLCREAGIPAVVGCGDGVVDHLAGRTVTVDGTTGRVLT